MTEARDGWSKIDIIAGIMTPILIAGFGTAFSWQQHKADEAQQTANRVAGLVRDLSSDRPEVKLAVLTLLSREREKHPEEVPEVLLASTAPTLVSLYKNDSNAEVARAAQQLVKDLSVKTEPALASSVAQPVEQISRVFIHVQSEDQREMARQIQAKLEVDGYVVPSIVPVTVGPRSPELRYLRRAEEKEAAQIATRVNSLNLVDLRPKYLDGYEDSKTLRPKTYELWFGSSK